MGLMARILVPVLKFEVRRRLKPGSDARQFRRALGKRVFPAPRGTRIAEGLVGGVPGQWVESKAANGITLLYIHGGAFVACSPTTHQSITGAFAKRGFRVFAIDYRLAPEHKFPAQLDDTEAAYRGLLAEGIPADRIAVAGESAGGNLTLALLLRLKETGGPMPAAVAAWSPATDLTGSSPSYTENAASDAMLDPETVRAVPGFYLPAGLDVNTPLASVVHGDFSGAPPILVHVANDEILRDDGLRLAEKARADGVSVAVRRFDDVPHAWQLFPILPEQRQSLDETAAFFVRHARA